MNTEKLRMFVTLAETLNFGRASEICHVSPSTLSRTIQQIEDELKAQLFYRDNRTVELTTAGNELLKYSRETLQQWETFKDGIQDTNASLQGEIRIYCSVTASYSFLYNILTDFRRDYPKIAIKLHTGDPAHAVERVAAGLEDIAIAAKEESLSAELSFKSITKSPLVFIAPLNSNWKLNQKANPAKVKETLESIPMILSESGVGRTQLNRWFETRSISPSIYAQVAGHEAIVSMVSLGFGLGCVPKIVLENSPLVNEVSLFTYQPGLSNYEVGVCVLNRRLKSPVVDALWSQV